MLLLILNVCWLDYIKTIKTTTLFFYAETLPSFRFINGSMILFKPELGFHREIPLNQAVAHCILITYCYDEIHCALQSGQNGVVMCSNM